MKGIISTNQPDKIELTLTITQTLTEWKELRDQLSRDKWPSWPMAALINKLVTKATSQHEEDSEEICP